MKDPKRPVGSFIFSVPRVGKTELARALAEAMFGAEDALVYDISEYMEKHAVSRLVSTPPDVGYDERANLRSGAENHIP